ncbi:MAG: hypothetical protein MUF62_02800 [Chitinophagaceae bacterium]|nr:hypothetical protein [Chitinophagaceae bacterium]
MKRWKIFWIVALLPTIAATAQRAGVVAGKLPQLAFSNGTDRLGSAKAGYLDTGIVVRVADSANGLYTLQLSRQRQAYLSKEFVQWRGDSLPQQPASTIP